jgi:hypothetical protein
VDPHLQGLLPVVAVALVQWAKLHQAQPSPVRAASAFRHPSLAPLSITEVVAAGLVCPAERAALAEMAAVALAVVIRQPMLYQGPPIRAAAAAVLAMELSQVAALAVQALSSCPSRLPITPEPQQVHPPSPHQALTPSSSSLLQGVTQREPLCQMP